MPKVYGVIKNDRVFEDKYMTDYRYRGTIYKISYDGEIYNSAEIKEKLIDDGYFFDTYLEEEIVLKAYIAYKNEAFKLFIGSFAVAIFNMKTKSLLLSKGGIGIKNLYYTKIPEGIVFSDSLTKILKSGMIKREITYKGIERIFLLNRFTNESETAMKKLLNVDDIVIFENNSIKNITKEGKNFITNEELQENFLDLVLRMVVPDIKVSVLVTEDIQSTLLVDLVSNILKNFNEKLNVISFKEIHFSKFYQIKSKIINSNLSEEKLFWLFNNTDIPIFSEQEYFNLLIADDLKRVSNIIISGNNCEFNASLFKTKLSILNKDFINNLGFLEYTDGKQDFFINHDRINKKFGLTFRYPFATIDLRNFFNNSFSEFDAGVNIYDDRIKKELVHILKIPSSPIKEFIDIERVLELNDFRIMISLIKLNNWLKNYSFNIL